MKQFRRIMLYIFFLMLFNAVHTYSCLKQVDKSTEPITLQFKHFAGNDLLVLDTVEYKNDLGQPYKVTKFKYYIGDIVLTASDNTRYVYKGYHLINEEDENTKKIILPDVPENIFKEISFIIGVDSIHNCSGVQSGDLDPVKGMFWAWNTGYIFLKMEGSSPFSSSAGHLFEYHIGGFIHPNNCIRKVTLNLENHQWNSNAVSGKIITIKTDVAEILKNPLSIDFSKMPVVTDFHNSTTIADNYADIFSIMKVE